MFGLCARGVQGSCREEIQSKPAAKLNVGPLCSSSTIPFITEGQRQAVLAAFDRHLSSPPSELDPFTVSASTEWASYRICQSELISLIKMYLPHMHLESNFMKKKKNDFFSIIISQKADCLQNVMKYLSSFCFASEF